MRNDPLSLAFFASSLVHLVVIAVCSVGIQMNHLDRGELLSISLIDLPPTETAPVRKAAAPAMIEKTLPPPLKVEKSKEIKAIAKAEMTKPKPPAVVPVNEEPPATFEAKSGAPAKADIPPIPASTARTEGGGREAGAGNLFNKGDVGVVPGSGTAGGGGGTAVSGLGRGSGAPGLPAQQPVFRTNREAKPIQTVKASYPPMALRMGMESDVTLKIEVDPDGKVTQAEITKSGGAGFDDEALRAVKQSRFEPAQRDGGNVSAEFIYIYRFRLRR